MACAVVGGVGTGDLVVSALAGELHVGNLEAQERPLGDACGKAHGDALAGRCGGAVDVHTVEALEHGDARGGAVKGRALGQLQGHGRDALAGLDRSLPGKACVHSADDAGAAVLVGLGGGLLGGHGKRCLRGGQGHAARRHEHRSKQGRQRVRQTASLARELHLLSIRKPWAGPLRGRAPPSFLSAETLRLSLVAA